MLTKDNWSNIAEYLNIKDFLTLTKVSKQFHDLDLNIDLWKKMFARDYGFLPKDCSDIKFKYIVAYHFKLGKEAMVLSKSRYFHQKVVALLKNYKQMEPWMNYYLGAIHTYGWDGDCNRVEKGVELLKANIQYYPALKELINFIYGGCPSYLSHKKNNLKSFVKNKLEKYKDSQNGAVLRDIGSLYTKDGIIYPKNLDTAIKFFQRAIKADFYEAYSDLGLSFLELDQKTDAENAYIAGDAKGVTQATHLLGDYYTREGKIKEAQKYYLKALENGDHEAGFKVGVIYGKEKKELVQPWFDELYKKGSSKAAFFLGALHQNQGKIENAIEWFTRGMQKGNDDSARFLGDLYLKVERLDPNKALEYYIMAYQLGSKKSLEKIAFVYLNYFAKLDANKIQECVYWLSMSQEIRKDLLSLIARQENLSQECSLAVNLASTIAFIKEDNTDKAMQLYDKTWSANPQFVDEIKKSATSIECLTHKQRKRLNSIFKRSEQSLEAAPPSSPGIK